MNRYPEGISTNTGRFLYDIDVAVAAMFGAAPHETVSSQAGRAAARGRLWGRWLGGMLDWLDPGHIARAIAHADQFLG